MSGGGEAWGAHALEGGEQVEEIGVRARESKGRNFMTTRLIFWVADRDIQCTCMTVTIFNCKQRYGKQRVYGHITGYT